MYRHTDRGWTSGVRHVLNLHGGRNRLETNFYDRLVMENEKLARFQSCIKQKKSWNMMCLS